MDHNRSYRNVFRGFTLAEMIVSTVIMSILAVGISSAVLVSTRALHNQDSQILRTQTAADISSQMHMEIATALDVSETTEHAITFNVPDRDGDGEEEQIRYFWSGVVGDPLYREYNYKPAFAMLNGIRTFTLAYRTVHVAHTGVTNEYYLAGHNATSNLTAFRLGNNNWLFQSFTPKLPSGATGWRISRVSIYGRSYGSTSGQNIFELRNALSDGKPGSTLICQTIIPESEFSSSNSWQTVTFPSNACTPGYVAPNQSVCLLIRGNVSDSSELRYHNRNVSLATYKFGISTNAGGSWSIKTSQAILFELYARVAGVSGGGGEGRKYLGMVRWRLAAGDDMASQVDGGVQIPNLPEVAE